MGKRSTGEQGEDSGRAGSLMQVLFHFSLALENISVFLLFFHFIRAGLGFVRNDLLSSRFWSIHKLL